jgi:hypothetical protein
VPHDSAPAPEPIPLTLGMPAAPARPRGLIEGLVRPLTGGTSTAPVPASDPAGPPDPAAGPDAADSARAVGAAAVGVPVPGTGESVGGAIESTGGPSGSAGGSVDTAAGSAGDLPGSAGAAVPVLDLGLPDERVADFLAGIVHTDTGFVARTASGERALAVVAGTVAALCGMDVRAALAAPDLEFLRGLRPAAVQAVREVLHAVESDSPESVARGLAPLAGVPPVDAAARPDPAIGQ